MVSAIAANTNQASTATTAQDKGKTKKTDVRKGKKKVSMKPTADEEPVVAAPETEVGAPEKDNGWWLRDSAIEELKGKTYLAGRQD